MGFFHASFDTTRAESLIGRMHRAKIEYAASVDSTNLELKRRLESGDDLPSGFTLIADNQTAGRGRQGKTWYSAAGYSLMFSTIIRTSVPAQQRSQLSLVAGLMICHALDGHTKTAAQVKWPNDILIEGRKLGGILIEVAELHDQPPLVIGVGINLGIPHDEFPPGFPVEPTSAMYHWRQDNVDREALLAVMVTKLITGFREYESGLWNSIRGALQARSYLNGRRVQVGETTGRVHGIGHDGELVLVGDDGQRTPIHSGNVMLCD